VQQFLAAVFEDGSHDECWSMMDDNLRLCLAQAWLWNNREQPNIAGRLDELAERFVRGPWPGDEMWEAFGRIDLNDMVRVWGDGYARDLGAASHPRPIGVDLEIVLLVPTDGEALVFHEATLVADALQFVVRLVDGVWRLAGVAGVVPVPGWPPVIYGPGGGV